tara:strand:- start:1203 stop:1481 length:279 start_codon:yes stop_codon:yes gene_type:complete
MFKVKIVSNRKEYKVFAKNAKTFSFLRIQEAKLIFLAISSSYLRLINQLKLVTLRIFQLLFNGAYKLSFFLDNQKANSSNGVVYEISYGCSE